MAEKRKEIMEKLSKTVIPANCHEAICEIILKIK